MTDTFRVISPGSGVQSFTLAVMSVLGDLTRVDAAVRGDIIYENALVYGYTKCHAREKYGKQKEKINTDPRCERLEEYARKQLKMGIVIIEKNGRKSVVISRGRFEPKREVNVLGDDSDNPEVGVIAFDEHFIAGNRGRFYYIPGVFMGRSSLSDAWPLTLPKNPNIVPEGLMKYEREISAGDLVSYLSRSGMI